MTVVEFIVLVFVGVPLATVVLVGLVNGIWPWDW